MIFFSWENVCRRRKQGGFDIREILSWNKTLMLKMFWNYNHNCTPIWMIWSREYIFKNHSCWELTPTDCVSFIWQRILGVRDDFVLKMSSQDAAQLLFQTWHQQGKFPLNEVYDIFHGTSHELRWMKPLLDSIVVPKHAFIATLVAHHSLATVDKICQRGMHLANRCTLYYTAAETSLHLFFECPFSTALMHGLLAWQGVTRRVLSLKHELYKLALNRTRKGRRKLACCALAEGVYVIWQERNCRIFMGARRTVEQLINLVKYFVCLRMYSWSHGLENDQLLSLLLD
ncbi:uncharacterized protein LOC141655412 [Silene latifolia]|uniref:uncharacterized protein LOC141655412 n=1 Tax=Silene latifolia TaxID=37657 RepID=UPI003D76F259